jgi:hypothetical protein
MRTDIAGTGSAHTYILTGFDFLATLWAIAWIARTWQDGWRHAGLAGQPGGQARSWPRGEPHARHLPGVP